jgi:O-antigen ligase
LNNLTTKVLISLVILVSWAKAGLAGDWILHTINLLVFTFSITLIKPKYNIRFRLLSILPLIIVSTQFLLSYSNPLFKIIDESGWAKLNIDKYFSQETDIHKNILVSKVFKDIETLSDQNPELALAIFFDFKNHFFDKYPSYDGPTANLIFEFEGMIQNHPNPFIPSSVLSNKGLIFNFINTISQVLIGFILFFSINKRKHIRRILLVLSINIGILAFVGILQKLNYKPSDSHLEIFGIWNTPEPRYFFSSFTYKNHWSAFALMGFSTSIALLVDSYRRYGKSFTKKISNFLLFLSTLFIIISFPLSGSRSGTILMILSFALLSFTTLKFLGFLTYRNVFIFLVLIILGLIAVLSFISKVNSNTTDEMTNNIKIQLTELSHGKLPLRILLWNDLFEQIIHRPIYGYGFNSYKIINPIYQSPEVRNLREKGVQLARQKYTPLIGYAHNDWLERISEFGLIGLFCVTPFLYFIFIQLFKSYSLFNKLILIGLVIYLIYSFIDFPSQTPANLILFSSLVGITLKYSFLTQKRVFAK